jgi:hypothetical protein
VRGCGAGPALRPFAVVEVEAGVPVLITRGFVERELSGWLIEADQTDTMDAIDVRHDRRVAWWRRPSQSWIGMEEQRKRQITIDFASMMVLQKGSPHRSSRNIQGQGAQ